MKTLFHHNQPYGTVEIEVHSVEPVTANHDSPDYIKSRAKKGWVHIDGTVLKGSERSRIFHYTSDRDLTGRRYSLELPLEDFERGHYTTVAM